MKTPAPSGNSTDPRNPELVDQLLGYLQSNSLENNSQTQRMLGKQLGYSDGTAVYRYLAAKPEGDLTKFETRLASFLANELRIEGGGALIADPSLFVTQAVFNFIRQTRQIGGIGVAFGPAGTGKTCAERIFAKQHRKDTIYTHVWSWACGKSALAREVCKSAGVKPGKKESWEAALRRHCRDGSIMLILDNAQRLTTGARHWLADFYDYTGTPIALFGNPEIVDQWAACDQLKRRCLLKQDVTLELLKENSPTATRTVDYLIQQHLPQAAENEAVKATALELLTARDSGACGTVIAHARLASLMLNGGKITDPAKAFDLANKQLIAA